MLSVFSRAAAAAACPLSTLLLAHVLTDELASPDSEAVAALRRAVQRRFGERVTGDAIVAGIDQWRARAAVPDTETVSSSSVGRTTPALPRTPRAKHGGAGAGRRVTILDLVEAGLLPPDAALEANVRGVSHAARVRDGMIDLDGRQFASPSAASQALRGTESWNGWVDWRHKGERLVDLRDRFRSAARREQLPKS